MTKLFNDVVIPAFKELDGHPSASITSGILRFTLQIGMVNKLISGGFSLYSWKLKWTGAASATDMTGYRIRI